MENKSDENYVYKNNETPILIIQSAENLFKGNYSVILRNLMNGLSDANITRIIVNNINNDGLEALLPYLFDHNASSIFVRLFLNQIPTITKTMLNNYNDLKVIACIMVENINAFSWANLENAVFALGQHLQGFLLTIHKKDLMLIPDILARIRSISPVPIIVSPDFGFNDDRINWLQLNELYSQMIAFNHKSNAIDATIMDYGYLPSRLLNEHPCNGYMCSGHTCHSFKGNLPRRLVLRHDGILLPESILVPDHYTIGNLAETSMRDILNQYRDSERHSLFLEAARNVYIQWVQTCPYKVIPWGALMVEQSNINRG